MAKGKATPDAAKANAQAKRSGPDRPNGKKFSTRKGDRDVIQQAAHRGNMASNEPTPWQASKARRAAKRRLLAKGETGGRS